MSIEALFDLLIWLLAFGIIIGVFVGGIAAVFRFAYRFWWVWIILGAFALYKSVIVI